MIIMSRIIPDFKPLLPAQLAPSRCHHINRPHRQGSEQLDKPLDMFIRPALPGIMTVWQFRSISWTRILYTNILFSNSSEYFIWFVCRQVWGLGSLTILIMMLLTKIVLLSSMVLVILMKMVCVVLPWETETKSDTRTPLISLLQCSVEHPFHIDLVQLCISPPLQLFMYCSVQVEGHLLVFWAQKHWTWISFWAECNLDQSHQSQCHRVSH